jgi:hypothetical protein
LVEIVLDANVFSMAAPSVGRILREVTGGFNMGRWELAWVAEARVAEAWAPRREGGRGCDRADMGRSSAAPVHDCALRMR